VNAQTVLGPIPAEALSLTLMHEHLLFDFSCCREAPRNGVERAMARAPVRMETLGALRFNPLVVPDNLVHADMALALEEVSAFVDSGGQTIVDPTNASIGRDPLALQEIARASGLNIIMGCGYYTQASLDERFEAQSADKVAREIVSDILDGVGGTGVCSGLIGEIGTSAPITPAEVKSLRAAARAQAETGAPLMIHPFPWGREGHRILDIVEEEGADLQRTILCHMNASHMDTTYQVSLAERGAVLEYDMLGIDHFYPPDMAAPGEIEAIEAIAGLVERGYLAHLLVSQDVYLKMMLTRYGGHGYAHIVRNLPPLFQAAGLTYRHLEVMMVDNPRRLLPFK
jgi:phosphotriesterase-related protein